LPKALTTNIRVVDLALSPRPLTRHTDRTASLFGKAALVNDQAAGRPAAEHLMKGTKIRINGLGIFQVRSRAARMGRNPATGEQIQIKASKKIAFRPAKELKDAV
jgi:DNA-binding protein HU-beta